MTAMMLRTTTTTANILKSVIISIPPIHHHIRIHQLLPCTHITSTTIIHGRHLFNCTSRRFFHVTPALRDDSTRTPTNTNNNNNVNNKNNTQLQPNNKNIKATTTAERIMMAQQNKNPTGVYDIEVPKLYPPPTGGISGARRRRRLRIRVIQRKNDHKKTHLNKPTTNPSTVNPRHLSLPPAEPKPRFPKIVIPRLKEIEYDKLEQMGLK